MIPESLMRLRFLLWRPKPEEFDEELRFHLEQSTDRNMAAGMTANEARRQAMIELGGLASTREQCNQARPGWWLATVGQDIRYALRGFRRDPVFALAVIATLALGVGATAAVFSVVDRILFRSLPYAHDDRLVSVGMVHSLERQEFMMGTFYFDWREHQRPFEQMAIQSTMPHACDLVENNPEQVDCLSFDAEFLPLLGISPVLGRNFLPEEVLPNGPRVAIISYGLWQDHYNRDPAILNRQIDVDGSPARVVGVLPRQFQFPTLQPADVLFPMALDRAAQTKVNSGFGNPMRTFARLKPGVSIEQARAEMEPLFDLTRDQVIPAGIRKDIHLGIRSLRDRETQDVQLTAWILLGSVLAVLLIACANVASLMMARGEARERELAVRTALGATRSRLVRQTLSEATLLSLLGAAGGTALAEGLLRIFVALAPSGIPFLSRATLDLRVACFAVLLSLSSALLFGLLPALETPRMAALSARAAKFRKRTALRRSLVVGQIAVSMVLLSGSALLVKSFRNMQRGLGLETGGVFTVRIALPDFRYDTAQKKIDFYLRAEAALRRLPAIGAVAISDSVPPGGAVGMRWSDLAVEGRPHPGQGTGETLNDRMVTPDYFRALNIPILRGRNFTEDERSAREPAVVVLSRLLAARLFAGEDPIGKRIVSGEHGTARTVVGVAENVKNGGLEQPEQPEIYFLRRNAVEDWDGPAPVMVVSSALSENTVAPWVRAQIAQIDSTVPIEIETLSDTVSRLANRPRFETALISFFAFCGLLMSSIGLYGLIAFIAAQRTQEIGIRMALGATRMNILRLIAGEGVRLILLGGAVGILAAMATAQLLTSLLFNVRPHDPTTYIAVAALLGLVAMIATLVPARAAMRVEPVVALRYE
jgi:putative ABC transport system permease protein